MTVPADVEVYLEVNSVPLDTHAWRVLSYGDLFSAPAVRGDDRIMPGAPGRRALRRLVDATVKSLSLHVYGWRDQDGGAIADPLEGLLTHAAYLRANLGLGLTTGDGTVPAVFHRGSLANLTGDVTVLAISDWQNVGGREATFRLDLSIPAGELT
jgi:hypothetical protein